jgi:isopenicillin N synthase-like dioxygenase
MVHLSSHGNACLTLTDIISPATDGKIKQQIPQLLKENQEEIETFAKVSVHVGHEESTLTLGAIPSPSFPYSPSMTLLTRHAQDLHDKVLDPLNHLIALALELPEDFFTSIHKWETHDESHFRYMKYSKFNEEEVEKLSDGLWSRGHTDLGTLTLLFRQPVAALQIRDHETNEWKWAKPLDGSLTVNTCDALSFLTGGYVKSTVHRVCRLSTKHPST